MAYYPRCFQPQKHCLIIIKTHGLDVLMLYFSINVNINYLHKSKPNVKKYLLSKLRIKYEANGVKLIILDKDMEISFERTDYLKTHLILNTIYHLETIVNENYLQNFVSVLMI